MKEENRGSGRSQDATFEKIFKTLSGSDDAACSLMESFEKEGLQLLTEKFGPDLVSMSTGSDSSTHRLFAYYLAASLMKYSFYYATRENLLALKEKGSDVARTLTTLDRMAAVLIAHLTAGSEAKTGEFFRACACAEGSDYTGIIGMFLSDSDKPHKPEARLKSESEETDPKRDPEPTVH